MTVYYLLLYFFVYGFLGWCTEVGFAAVKEHRFVNRGFLNGPICPIYGVGVSAVIAVLTPYKSNLILLYILSVILVTVLEGLTGWAMDKIFHNKWWDYSEMPLNIGGYVCLLFSLVWGIACVVIMKYIHPGIHWLLTFIPHTLGIILIIVLGIILFADLYVTASAIFKFNRHLESMEKIAEEMHEISDQIGQEIFEKTIQAVEFHETSRQKLDDAANELKSAISELHEKTQDAISELQERTQDAVSEFHERTQDAVSELQERTQDAISELREKQQNAAEHSQDISEELREHIAELRQRYSELGFKQPRISQRLVKAFPKMESRKYKDQLDELKKKWKR